MIAEQVCTVAEHQSDERDDAQAPDERLVDAAVILCAEVLAGEADGGLVERVHRNVHKALNVGCGGVAREPSPRRSC